MVQACSRHTSGLCQMRMADVLKTTRNQQFKLSQAIATTQRTQRVECEHISGSFPDGQDLSITE